MVGGDVERHNNRGVVGGLHGFGNRRVGLGGDAEIDIAQINAVIVQLPGDDAIGDLGSTVADADRGLGYLRVPQELGIELGFWNLVKETLADLMDREETLLGLRLFGDDFFMLRVRSRQGGVGSSSSTAGATGSLRRFVLSEHREREQQSGKDSHHRAMLSKVI
jgi:hypothetical protein